MNGQFQVYGILDNGKEGFALVSQIVGAPNHDRKIAWSEMVYVRDETKIFGISAYCFRQIDLPEDWDGTFGPESMIHAITEKSFSVWAEYPISARHWAVALGWKPESAPTPPF